MKCPDLNQLFVLSVLALPAAVVHSSDSKTVAVELRLTATVGDRVVLPCVSHEQPHKEVDWRYRETLGAPEQYVWNRKWLVDSYKSRCTIETVAAGHYNLVFHRVQLNDTGFYDCIERGGYGKRHRLRLDVLPAVVTSPQTHSTGKHDTTKPARDDARLWKYANLFVGSLTFVFTGIILVFNVYRMKNDRLLQKKDKLLGDIETGEAETCDSAQDCTVA